MLTIYGLPKLSLAAHQCRQRKKAGAGDPVFYQSVKAAPDFASTPAAKVPALRLGDSSIVTRPARSRVGGRAFPASGLLPRCNRAGAGPQ